MVGQQILDLLIGVRIPAGQHMIISLQAGAIVLLFVWELIWIFTERESRRKKSLIEKSTVRTRLKRVLVYVFGLLGVLQILGIVDVWTFPVTQLTDLIGFSLVSIGFLVSFSARLSLGANWAHGAEYQIVKNHELITGGVYSFIRHPIYAGLFLAVLGIEILAHSYLVVPVALAFSFGMYKLAKKEEKLLTKHFDSQYKDYMKSTKMFLPYLF